MDLPMELEAVASSESWVLMGEHHHSCRDKGSVQIKDPESLEHHPYVIGEIMPFGTISTLLHGEHLNFDMTPCIGLTGACGTHACNIPSL